MLKQGPNQISKFSRAVALVASAHLLLACSKVGFELTPEGQDKAITNDPNAKTDVFNFNDDRPRAQVDILFVVDNSGSMYAEQQKLATRLSSFIGSLNLVDWRIGITTSDVSTGPFGLQGTLVKMVGLGSQILSASTPNFQQVFKDTITVNGTSPGCATPTLDNCPSGDEQPLTAIALAAQKHDSANRGFFRPGADLVSIILTDEDEMSSGNNRTDGRTPTSPELVVRSIKQALGEDKVYSSFGILVESNDPACLNAQAPDGRVGTFAIALALLTGGTTGSICAEDYGPTLASIGQRVRRTATSLRLTSLARPETVRVQMTPADPSMRWTFRDNAVQFDDLPARGTTVRVTYLPAE